MRPGVDRCKAGGDNSLRCVWSLPGSSTSSAKPVLFSYRKATADPVVSERPCALHGVCVKLRMHVCVVYICVSKTAARVYGAQTCHCCHSL